MLGRVIHLVEFFLSLAVGPGLLLRSDWWFSFIAHHSLADKYALAYGCTTNICRYINHYIIFDVSPRMY